MLLIPVQGRLQLWLRIRGATLLFSRYYVCYLGGCQSRHQYRLSMPEYVWLSMHCWMHMYDLLYLVETYLNSCSLERCS